MRIGVAGLSRYAYRCFHQFGSYRAVFLSSICKRDDFSACFFSRFRSGNKPPNRTESSSFTFYMGNSSSGKYVNERSVMQMTAMYACVRILSEAVTGLPLHLYRYNDSGHLYYSCMHSNEEADTMRNETVILQPSDVLHIPCLGFDGLVGYSPIGEPQNNGTAAPSPFLMQPCENQKLIDF